MSSNIHGVPQSIQAIMPSHFCPVFPCKTLRTKSIVNIYLHILLPTSILLIPFCYLLDMVSNFLFLFPFFFICYCELSPLLSAIVLFLLLVQSQSSKRKFEPSVWAKRYWAQLNLLSLRQSYQSVLVHLESRLFGTPTFSAKILFKIYLFVVFFLCCLSFASCWYISWCMRKEIDPIQDLLGIQNHSDIWIFNSEFLIFFVKKIKKKKTC